MNELISKAAAKASRGRSSWPWPTAHEGPGDKTCPNQIIRTGEFELIVDDDENGDGLVVQIILPLEQMEGTGPGQGLRAGRSGRRLERSREAGMDVKLLERTGFVFGQMAGNQDATLSWGRNGQGLRASGRLLPLARAIARGGKWLGVFFGENWLCTWPNAGHQNALGGA